jgi:hypothetical protein
MKRFALIGLSLICLSLVSTTSAQAGSLSAQTATVSPNQSQPTPSVLSIRGASTGRIAMSAQTATVTPNTPQSTTPVLSIRGASTGLTAMSTATLAPTRANPKLTPFALVTLAYQGEYRVQGIPGFGGFESGVASKTIAAKDLVKAAIAAEELAPDTQTDRAYLNSVEQQLSITHN